MRKKYGTVGWETSLVVLCLACLALVQAGTITPPATINNGYRNTTIYVDVNATYVNITNNESGVFFDYLEYPQHTADYVSVTEYDLRINLSELHTLPGWESIIFEPQNLTYNEGINMNINWTEFPYLQNATQNELSLLYTNRSFEKLITNNTIFREVISNGTIINYTGQADDGEDIGSDPWESFGSTYNGDYGDFGYCPETDVCQAEYTWINIDTDRLLDIQLEKKMNIDDPNVIGDDANEKNNRTLPDSCIHDNITINIKAQDNIGSYGEWWLYMYCVKEDGGSYEILDIDGDDINDDFKLYDMVLYLEYNNTNISQNEDRYYEWNNIKPVGDWIIKLESSNSSGVKKTAYSDQFHINDRPSTNPQWYPEEAYRTDDLIAQCRLSDSDSDTVDINYTIYNNSAVYIDSFVTNAPTNTLINLTTISNTDVSLNDTWVVQCEATDGFATDKSNSSLNINDIYADILLNYSDEGFSTSEQSFAIDLYPNLNITVNSCSGTFVYENHTSSSLDFHRIDNYIRLNTSITLPLVNSDTNYSLYFNYTCNTDTINSQDNDDTRQTTGNHTVRNWRIYGCASGDLQFYIRKENDVSSALSADIEYVFDYWLENESLSKTINGSLTDNDLQICIEPSTVNLTTNAYIKYDEAFMHRYYLVYRTLTNTTTQEHIYNWNTTEGLTELEVTMKDQDTFENLENHYALLQRYYVDEDTWRTVQMGKSGPEGRADFNVVERDIDYRFLFWDSEGNILRQTSSQTFSCTGVCEVTYLLSDFVEGDGDPDVDMQLNYNNDTEQVTLLYEYATGQNSPITFQVYQTNWDGRNYICDETVISAEGNLTCNVSNYEGQIFARGYADGYYQVTENYRLSETFLGDLLPGASGALWAFFIALVLIGLGLTFQSPVAVIMATMMSVVVTFWLDIFGGFSHAILVAAGVIALIISLKIKN